MRMSKVFTCRVGPGDFTVISGVIREYADDGVSAHEATAHAVNNYDEMADEIEQLKKDNKKLKFMIDNGLGSEDMRGGDRSDIS